MPGLTAALAAEGDMITQVDGIEEELTAAIFVFSKMGPNTVIPTEDWGRIATLGHVNFPVSPPVSGITPSDVTIDPILATVTMGAGTSLPMRGYTRGIFGDISNPINLTGLSATVFSTGVVSEFTDATHYVSEITWPVDMVGTYSYLKFVTEYMTAAPFRWLPQQQGPTSGIRDRFQQSMVTAGMVMSDGTGVNNAVSGALPIVTFDTDNDWSMDVVTSTPGEVTLRMKVPLTQTVTFDTPTVFSGAQDLFPDINNVTQADLDKLMIVISQPALRFRLTGNVTVV